MNTEIEDIKNPINLVELRRKHNLSQEMLARMLSCSLQSIQRWENKDNTPSPVWRREIRRLEIELREA